MKALSIIASTMLVAGAAADSATADARTIGILVCNVGAPPPVSGQDPNSDGQRALQSRDIRCILRNHRTGTSNEYLGTLLLSKSLNAETLDPTLLWNVVVDPPATAKTLLDQTFSMDPDNAQKPYVVITGDNQSTVELRLERSKDATLKNGVLGMKLTLQRAAT